MTSGVGAVIPAAGLGLRLRDPADAAKAPPKALRLLAGESLLVHAVRALAPWVEQIVIAAPPDEVLAVAALFGESVVPVVVVAGGETRQASVCSGLAALGDEIEFVLVHDAARPLVPSDVMERVVRTLQSGAEAVVPVVGAADSLRRLVAGGSSQIVDRSEIVAVQTPQGFRRTTLEAAHAASVRSDASDDAMLVEAGGTPIVLVEGSPEAFKVTRPFDLIIAEATLAARHR